MSISLCFRGIDGILLATDSAVTIISQDLKSIHTEHNSQRLWKIANNMGVISIGTHEDYRKYVLSKVIEHYKDSGQAEVEKVIELIKTDYLERMKGYNESEVRRMGYQMTMTMAGYDNMKPYLC